MPRDVEANQTIRYNILVTSMLTHYQFLHRKTLRDSQTVWNCKFFRRFLGAPGSRCALNALSTNSEPTVQIRCRWGVPPQLMTPCAHIRRRSSQFWTTPGRRFRISVERLITNVPNHRFELLPCRRVPNWRVSPKRFRFRQCKHPANKLHMIVVITLRVLRPDRAQPLQNVRRAYISNLLPQSRLPRRFESVAEKLQLLNCAPIMIF